MSSEVRPISRGMLVICMRRIFFVLMMAEELALEI